MHAFAALFEELDRTTKTKAKVQALAAYFASAPPEDAIWVLHFLGGRKRRRYIGTTKLREWAAEYAGIEPWLFNECYSAVGDLGETLGLLVHSANVQAGRTPATELPPLHRWVQDVLQPLKAQDEEQQKAVILDAWRRLDQRTCFLFNKLAGGSFRVGVSQKMVVKALAEATGHAETALAHQLMGDWPITGAFFESLFEEQGALADRSQPYPFYLAYALEGEPAELGPIDEWQAEWKWDGIRAQVISRGGEAFVWSRGEELITPAFPELEALAKLLPDGTVLDGELMPYKDGKPLGFNALQRRLGRKKVGPKLLKEVPVVLYAYDLLEEKGKDLREVPLLERRQRLEGLLTQLGQAPVLPSPMVQASSWEELAAQQAQARARLAEGLMLKHKQSPYRVGRKKGGWWKWKVEPLSLDAIMVYAQRGTGRRASLYTDYTFAVRDEASGELVTFAKAYSGLTDDEIAEVDRFVRRNTLEKFGPVRVVKPELVFELGFEGIRESSRHKSGVAVRFPRMLRWRKDKPATEANTLADLQALLKQYG